MKEEDRERILEKLRLVWNKHPELRFCQLVWNMAYRTGQVTEKHRDIFHVDDGAFEFILDQSEVVAEK